MSDLSRFSIGISSLGDSDLECSDCYWRAELTSDNNLAELVTLAEAHRCTVVVEGATVDPTRLGDPPRHDLVVMAYPDDQQADHVCP